MKISAYIPCYNNRDTIEQAIESVHAQSRPVDELFVVDDGSRDGSGDVAASLGVRVIAQPANKGRGATRACAMEEARYEWVLCCDATQALGADFVKNAVSWLDDPGVAAVFGPITQKRAVGAVERWRGRHLFKECPAATVHGAGLITAGALVRASAVKAVGNFNPDLRYGEDFELGARLLAAGHDVICDPRLQVMSIARNTLWQVLERYWRWNTAPHGRMGFVDYLRQIVYSIKVMARADLRAGDPLAACISLVSPHYQFWVPLMTKKE